LTPKTGGGWTERVLHLFNDNGKDGWEPEAGLVVDAAGSLYGTTYFGGANNAGMVFKLTPNQGGGWSERILYSFSNDGTGDPGAGLIFDPAGNLYGTTNASYNGGCVGTVFELRPTGGGRWAEKTLHTFGGNGTGGCGPLGNLVFDASGNLYGTTEFGGTYGYGIVFELVPKPSGAWTESILHVFKNDGTDGKFPLSGVIFDAAGNLYGTTWQGGSGTNCGQGVTGCGTVYELSPIAGGGWTETVLHTFNNNGRDGWAPEGLIFGAAGTLYGTTGDGGKGAGTVFELTPDLSGEWTETLLFSFGNGVYGGFPLGNVILDAAGNLYGTTDWGGTYGAGTVFEITP
jgi:uncharacterized repeat protein (TIGR03803 family)